MTALMEEHVERQRRCCARIQEEHGVLAASLAAAAAAAHAATKLRADNAAKATEMKERYEDAVLETQASLAALVGKWQRSSRSWARSGRSGASTSAQGRFGG